MSELQSLDLSRLLLVHAGLSLAAAVSVSPAWNFPLSLYGLVVVNKSESQDGGDSVRQFSLLLAASFIFDLFWFMSGWTSLSSSFSVFLIIANLALKPVTLLAALGHLRQRGEPAFNLPGSGAFSLPGSFPPSGGVRETVWSAPSGVGGGRYQGFPGEEEEEVGTPKAPAKPSAGRGVQKPATGLSSAGAAPAGAEGGGYHTLV